MGQEEGGWLARVECKQKAVVQEGRLASLHVTFTLGRETLTGETFRDKAQHLYLYTDRHKGFRWEDFLRT